MLVAFFVVWTVLILKIDVQEIGPNKTEVGLATWNYRFHQLTGVNSELYRITDWLGLIPVVVCMGFAGLGMKQLVQRRSLLKVDRDIILLGVYYVVVIFSYLIFEMIPVNYRPVLIEGRLEASYPSSTTLLVLGVMPTFTEQMNRRLKNRNVKRMIKFATIGFSACMVLGRLVSGVHWFTDIVGAVILSGGLFCFYRAMVLLGQKEEL